MKGWKRSRVKASVSQGLYFQYPRRTLYSLLILTQLCYSQINVVDEIYSIVMKRFLDCRLEIVKLNHVTVFKC